MDGLRQGADARRTGFSRGTGIQRQRLDDYLNAFTFRFNRRRSQLGSEVKAYSGV